MRFLSLVFAFILLGSIACTPAGSTQPTPPGEAKPSGQPTPVSTQAPLATPAPKAAAGDCTSSPDALSKLTSYRYSYLLNAESTTDGKTESGSIELSGEYVAPDRQHLKVSVAGSADFEFVQIGQDTWFKSGSIWTKVPGGGQFGQFEALAPARSWADFYQGVSGDVRYVGNETMNGIEARHCASNWGGFGGLFGSLSNAKGDLWLAVDGGWPVRYVFTGEGRDASGSGAKVEARLDISNANDPGLKIEPPS